MTQPGVTDDVRINVSRIFACDFDRDSLLKYNAVIRVPLRARVPEIFAKNFFTIKNSAIFHIFYYSSKVIKIST